MEKSCSFVSPIVPARLGDRTFSVQSIQHEPFGSVRILIFQSALDNNEPQNLPKKHNLFQTP